MTLACRRRNDAIFGIVFLLVALQKCEETSALVPLSTIPSRQTGSQSLTRNYRDHGYSRLQNAAFYNDFDEDDDDDDDDLIDPDSLGNWRDFRRNLARTLPDDEEWEDSSNVRTSVSAENEELLLSQNKELAEEYKKGVWAHEISTPEVGGLVVRMPIEVELYRNYRHSIIGQKLRKKHLGEIDSEDALTWYKKAQALVEDEMQGIAENADESGQIDSSTLSDDSTEMLQIFLDNQEYWQEVCLVVEKDDDLGTAKALVLNRPMAMKLTDNLSRLVLHGNYQYPESPSDPEPRQHNVDIVKFMLAFGQECAVYVGGTDDQDQAAIMIHGIKDLPGAREISPGAGIYEGGVEAAVEGVLKGKYKPLDFRFFVGCHTYDESLLDVAVVLGKYQPVACARSLALKQCISLPKPLWHEVLELCGGHMSEVSALEMLKHDDILFQVIDEDDVLDELALDDDDDDDYYED